ncbi:MAG: creatininase family protein, partial [Actinobacteria bacterium]|nr:creatininase family protein [Actinomycetota bacterium]
PHTFYELLFDLCDSIASSGFTRICLLVGHASNRPFVNTVVSQFMQQRGVRLLQLNYLFFGAETFARVRTTTGGDAHAGELETSVMMHLRPELVKPVESAPRHPVDPVRDYGLSAAGSDLMRPGQATIGFDLKATFPDGVMGDPTVASAETGRQVFAAIVEGVLGVLDEYHEM